MKKKRNTQTNKQTPQLKTLLHRCKTLEVFYVDFFSSKRLKWTRQDRTKLPTNKTICSRVLLGHCAVYLHLNSSIYSSVPFYPIFFIWIKCQLHWVKHSPGERKHKAAYTCTQITFNSSSSNNNIRTSCVGFEFLLRGKWTESYKYTTPLHSFTGCPSIF